MAETLLTPSSIKLYGRVMTGIAIDASSLTNQAGQLGANRFLRNQLVPGPITFYFSGWPTTGSPTVKGDPTSIPPDLINAISLLGPNPPIGITDSAGGIYIPTSTNCTVAVTYTPEGAVDTIILTLSANATKTADPKKPSVSLVLQVYFSPTIARIYSFSFEGAYYQLPRPALFLVHGPGTPVGNWVANSTMDQAGVVGREWDFSGNGFPTDLVSWEYEKGDFSLRLDLDAGPFEQILLQTSVRAGVGVSGAGVSGAGVSGAGVSGAGVSGAGVSGAGVSGAGVSGAGVRR
jgi:hypothetical protein